MLSSASARVDRFARRHSGGLPCDHLPAAVTQDMHTGVPNSDINARLFLTPNNRYTNDGRDRPHHVHLPFAWNDARVFGLAALESIVHGTPVIISKQSGVSEVVQNALKVDFWDVDEMVNKILSVLSHSSLKNTLSENGALEIGLLSWDTAASECIRIYNELLNK